MIFPHIVEFNVIDVNVRVIFRARKSQVSFHNNFLHRCTYAARDVLCGSNNAVEKSFPRKRHIFNNIHFFRPHAEPKTSHRNISVAIKYTKRHRCVTENKTASFKNIKTKTPR